MDSTEQQQHFRQQVRDTIVPIFTTPIANYLWKDSDALNAALRSELLQREGQNDGISRSNVGGWHSDTDLFAWDLECVAELHENIRRFIEELTSAFASDQERAAFEGFRVEGWANVLRYGQYNSLHSHPNAFWSGVYYVNGNPKPELEHAFSGKLELIDPRPGASLQYTPCSSLYGRFLVNPNPGQMIVFPGWLQHQVHPYFGPGERVSIAFNVVL